MKKSRDKDSFIKKPEYPGGKAAMDLFVKQNLKYPKAALKNKIEGKVLVEFKIEFDGTVSDPKVLRSIGHGCDEEAVRIVKLLLFNSPKNRGSRVSVRKKLGINFKLPPQKKVKKTQQSFQYTYTKSKDKASKTYNYKVNL